MEVGLTLTLIHRCPFTEGITQEKDGSKSYQQLDCTMREWANMM